MPQPDAPNPSGRDSQCLLAQFVHDASFPSGRLRQGQLDDHLFHLGGDPILQERFLS